MELLNIRDAAEVLKVCPQTIRNYIRRGYLRGYRVNPKGKLFLRTDDLERLMGVSTKNDDDEY